MNVRGVIKNEKDELAKLCYDKMKEMYNDKYSELIKIFYGFTITEITSITSNKCIIKTSQPFFMLNLPIPVEKKEVTLTDCLNSYLEHDTITYSHDGQSEDCYKYLKICNLPDILIISFNRFNHLNRKNHKIIYFPFDNLDLNAYVHGYNENKEFMYDLYGICNHSGSSLGGHYTSMVKNANGSWYSFNDRIVNKLEMNIQNLYTKAYVLFYRKKKQ
jgi:ubiquitin C-terminal hydrolase